MTYRVRCRVSYDGGNYSGFQRQNNAATIQGQIEKSLFKIHREQIKIYAASRTDAKVHANDQVFHFDTELVLKESRWKLAINTYLPNDIYIKEVAFVDQSFHSRFSVWKKKYRYVINIGEYSPLDRERELYLRKKIDFEKISQQLPCLVGEHDFKSFTSSVYDNYVRQIYKAEVEIKDNKLIFTFIGSGFMRYMVRIIVGTLIDIGVGKRDDLKGIIDSKNRNEAGDCVSAHGLYLEQIWYLGGE